MGACPADLPAPDHSSPRPGNMVDGAIGLPIAGSVAPLAGTDPAGGEAHEAVVTPGSFGGWIELTRRFGRLPLSKLLEPAIGYARDGHPIDPSIARTIERQQAQLAKFPTTAAIFLPNGKAPPPRSLFKNEPLSRTLQALAAAFRSLLTLDDRRRLAFDHRTIVLDGLDRARAKLEYTPLASAFCASEFTVAELRHVYEIVWGTELDPRNFHRKVTKTSGFLEAAGKTTTRDGGRPAQLYRRGHTTLLYPPLLRSSDEILET